MRTSDAVCVAYPRQCQVVLAEAVMKRGLQQRRGTKNPLRMNCEGCSVVSPGAFLMPSPLPRLTQEADHTLDHTFFPPNDTSTPALPPRALVTVKSLAW